MTKRVLVIADDFTGAAEIGGVGVQHDLATTIVAGAFGDDDGADLLIVDTDTRHRPPREAADRVASLLGGRNRNEFGLIYKKTDSVLRGPIVAELRAIMDVLGFDKALLAPQNPTLGRVIRDGRYFVHGVPLDQTEFARDPEHPRTSADVLQLIGGANDLVTIASAETTEQLRAVAGTSSAVLPAGGADFFAAVLEHHGFDRTGAATAFPVGGPQLFVCGSACASSRCAVEAARTRGIVVVPMAPRLFHSAVRDRRMIEEWADCVGDVLRVSGTAVIAATDPPVPHRVRHVRQVMASAVASIVSQQRIDTLWIEGGATAAEILYAMKWGTFRVEQVLTRGVVSLRTLDWRNQRLVIKPGSYAWPPGVM